MSFQTREIAVGSGRVLKATPIFDAYWRFATERQQVFHRRVRGEAHPWTDDSVLAAYRFTNVYRASDRVSQYLIRNVIYEGSQHPEEVFFRTLLFKFFNRIETWEALADHVGSPTWVRFDFSRYCRVLDDAFAAGERLYSAAYIMPSPLFGNARKHKNHHIVPLLAGVNDGEGLFFVRPNSTFSTLEEQKKAVRASPNT